MLSKCRVWAVVGDALNQAKPAYKVAARLRSFNKTVHIVNPRDGNCHPNLSAVKDRIEAVNLIISPKIGPAILDEMIQLQIKNLFVQPGAGTPEIISRAKENGIEVIESCVLITPDSAFQESKI